MMISTPTRSFSRGLSEINIRCLDELVRQMSSSDWRDPPCESNQISRDVTAGHLLPVKELRRSRVGKESLTCVRTQAYDGDGGHLVNHCARTLPAV